MQIKSGSARVCFASSSQIICIGAVGRKQKKQEFSLLWRKARQDLVAWWHRVLSSLSTVPGSAADASHNHRSSTSSSSWWVSLKLPKARLERERKKVGEGKIPNDGGGGGGQIESAWPVAKNLFFVTISRGGIGRSGAAIGCRLRCIYQAISLGGMDHISSGFCFLVRIKK